MPSPLDENQNIDLYATFGKHTRNSVSLVNNSPYIESNVDLNMKVLSSNKISNYYEKEDLKLIETYAHYYIEDMLYKYLYKTSKNFKSDIALFGRYAVRNFSTLDKWEEYNWLENYSNAFFKLNLNVNVIS